MSLEERIEQRKEAKRLFDEKAMFRNNPVAWTAWKMAFDAALRWQADRDEKNYKGMAIEGSGGPEIIKR